MRPTAGDEPREFTSRGEGGRVPPFFEKLRSVNKMSVKMSSAGFPRSLRFIAFVAICLSLSWFSGPIRAGTLAEKAAVFDKAIEEFHTPNGMVSHVKLGPDGKVVAVYAGGDSTIWTGAWLAAQAYRYAATKDPIALDNIERGLRAFHSLHAMSGSPGFMGRSFGPPEWFGDPKRMRHGVGSYSARLFIPDTSRDQYTGIFLAYTLCLPLVGDPKLLAELKDDILAIGRNLMQNDLALLVNFDSKKSFMFNLNPTYCYQDRITPEEWATVDDFPVNVFAQTFPYNATMAVVLSTFQPPPMRGGEALRALMILQTAASATHDPELKKFFDKELCGRRRFPRIASETSQILSDLYDGRCNEIFLGITRDLAVSILELEREALVRFEWLSAPAADWLVQAARPLAATVGQMAGKTVLLMLALVRGPGGFRWFETAAKSVKAWADLLDSAGAVKETARLRKIVDRLTACAYSDLDEMADAQRSYVGTNLTFFALLGLFESPSGGELADSARDIVGRAFMPIADEGNSLYTFICQAFGRVPLSQDILDRAKATLRAYPLDQRDRSYDHSGDSGLRLLPWPDRFGRVGNQAAGVIPIDQRGPDIFIWQDSPRSLRTGSHGGILVPPVGYLLAYWFGRAHGLLSDAD